MELVKYVFDITQLPNGVLTIIPLSDIQFDGTEESTALRLLKETIQRGMDQKAYFIGGGDYVDVFSPSNRQRLKSAALYDTATDFVERSGMKLVEELYEILKPTTGRWLGLLSGHHWQEYADGTTSDMKLASMLRTRHLGDSAYIGLMFKRGKSGLAVNIWCAHGDGGGQSPAAPINKLDTRIVPAYDADIYLMSHCTKLAHTVVNRIYPAWGGKEPDLHHRDLHLVGTGGFSRGVQVGKRRGQVATGSYIEQAMFRPTSLGAPTITITPQRVHNLTQDKLTRRITITL